MKPSAANRPRSLPPSGGISEGPKLKTTTKIYMYIYIWGGQLKTVNSKRLTENYYILKNFINTIFFTFFHTEAGTGN